MNREIFARRRQQLLEKLPANSAVILRAATEKKRNNDVYYPFRQDSYFWYYCGFPEADAVAVFLKKNNSYDYILYSAPRNPLREIWEGKIIGQESALANYDVTEALPLSELSALAEKVANVSHIYCILGNPETDSKNTKLLREIDALSGRGGAGISGLHDLRVLADEQRLIKSADEIELMQKASEISALGHRAAMLASKNAKYEYQIQSALEAEFRNYGCNWSFPSIIAGGENACCLHYRDNNAPLKAGDLLLVDAGAEYQFYAGDLTRTFPINGKFTKQQEALYEVVLNAQKVAIKAAKVGIKHLELHEITAKSMIQGLRDLGLVKNSVDDEWNSGDYKRYYPHGTGHWLGMDVHDVGIYKIDNLSRTYQKNMAITIEPGLYFQTYDLQVPEEWRGIGIRIEDDVLISEEGGIVLNSSAAPKEVREIEALLNGKD